MSETKSGRILKDTGENAALEAHSEGPCGICGNEALEHINAVKPGTALEFPYRRCLHCGTGQLVERPTETAIQALYQTEYRPCCMDFGSGDRSLLARLHQLNFERIARRIEAKTSGRRLLDVGCGGGIFLSTMRARGWDVAGIEPNEQLAAALRTQLQLDVHAGRVEEAPERWAPFDVVTLFDMLEHVPEPRTALAKAWTLLKPGGMLVILTPNMGSLEYRVFGKYWYGFQAPDHLWLFTRHSLTQLVTDVGFIAPKIEPSAVSYAWSSIRSAAGLSRIPEAADALLKGVSAVPFGLAGMLSNAPAQLELYTWRP